MAKKSMIAREVKRKKLVKKYAAKRKALLDEFNAAKDPMERLEIHRKIQGLPRNSAPNRVRNRCWATGKPRGVYRDCLLYTSPSPRDRQKSRMPSSA